MSATLHTRPSTRRRAAALLAATAAAATTAVVVMSSASAQAPATRTLSFHELDKGSTFIHVRNTRTASQQSNSQGDLIVFTNPVADASGTRIGKLHAQCVTTVGARDFRKSTITCTAGLHLRDGNLMGQFITSLAGTTTTGAITGGTGAYANARGVIVSKQTQGGSNDTITLTG
jgi:allene oxide cyclase-like protein